MILYKIFMKSRSILVISLIVFAITQASTLISYSDAITDADDAQYRIDRARAAETLKQLKLKKGISKKEYEIEMQNLQNQDKIREQLKMMEKQRDFEEGSKIAALDRMKKLNEQLASARSRLKSSQQAGSKITEDNPDFIFILEQGFAFFEFENVSKEATIARIKKLHEEFGVVYTDDFFEKREQRLSNERKRITQQATQELSEKQQAILKGQEKLNKETAEWNAIASNASPKSPFVNSAGIRLVRVSGADFLVSISPVSKSAMAKSNRMTTTDNAPARNTWREANDFCTWLSYAENKNYHLPSEKEWKAVVQSRVLDGKFESWAWSSDVASAGESFGEIGDGKGLRGNSVKILDRTQSYDDVVIHCILAPKM